MTGDMRRQDQSPRGFTLVEVTVVLLILTLLVYSVILLLNTSSERFAQQEQAVICTAEAGSLFAWMREDLEVCVASDTDTDQLVAARNAITYKNEVLQFRVIGRQGMQKINYVYDKQNRSIERRAGDVAMTIGRGMVSSFFAVTQVLTDEDLIRSYPMDPESATPDPPLGTRPPRVLRTWLKLLVTFEGRGGKTVTKQEYAVRLFPIRLNRQFQSIWSPRP